MSSDSVSNTDTPSITHPTLPQSQPQPQPEELMLSGNEASLSAILSQPVNNPNPNHEADGDYGLSVGPGGLRVVDSSLNPFSSFGSLSLVRNSTEMKYSDGLEFSKMDDVMTEKPAPFEGVEGSDKKGKSKVSFQVEERSKDSVSGSDDSGEGEEALELCGEESNMNSKEDEGEEVVKKTWNLRPRKENKVTKSGTTSKMATRPRTPRAANGSGSSASVFSLTLTKSEIEEDFLKMTGQLPPKKPQRRAKSVQKHIDGIFPGMYLDKVSPQTYKSS